MKKKRKKKRTLESVLLSFFIVLFLIASVASISDHLWQRHLLQQEKESVLLQIEKEKQNALEYQKSMDYYTSDAYTEKIAREQLGLLKPGEIVYINKTAE